MDPKIQVKGKDKVEFDTKAEEPQGVLNRTLNVYEYVCFSIFRTRELKLRYCRIKDTIIPIPPVSTDRKFRASHSRKSVYYLGE